MLSIGKYLFVVFEDSLLRFDVSSSTLSSPLTILSCTVITACTASTSTIYVTGDNHIIYQYDVNGNLRRSLLGLRARAMFLGVGAATNNKLMSVGMYISSPLRHLSIWIED